MFRYLISLTALMLAATAAGAASPDAWETFRRTVEAECRALAEAELEDVTVRVDPFGAESYGVALIGGRSGDTKVQRICVMDKASGTAELGGELPGEEATATDLDPADAAELEGMVETARATIADLDSRDEPRNREADTAAAAVLSGDLGSDLTAVQPGAYRCAVYWYGFLDQGSDLVGSHQCRISDGPDGLTVEKTSGERISAVLRPLGEATAYVGRTYLEDHAMTAYDPATPANAENANFGNKVGLVFVDGDAVYLLSTQARGMQPKDDTFFEIIALEPA